MAQSAMGSLRLAVCCDSDKNTDTLPASQETRDDNDESIFPPPPKLAEAVHDNDESFFTPPATCVAQLLAFTSADEATEALVRLLQVLDARHEAIIRRVEDRVHRTVLEHLDKVTDAISKIERDEAPRMTTPSDSRKLQPSRTAATMPVFSPAKSAATMPVFSPAKSAVAFSNASDEAADKSIACNGVVSNPPSQSGDANTMEAKKTEDADAKQTPKVELRSSTFRTSSSQDLEQVAGADFNGVICDLEVIEAQGLVASDVNCCGQGASDPYVKVLLKSKEGEQREVFRTHTQKSTLNPKFNAFCKLKADANEDEVVVELWDEDQFDKDDLLAKIHLHLSDVQMAGGSLARWFEIEPQEDCPTATGKILLKLSIPQSSKEKTLAMYSNLVGWDGHEFVEETQQKTPRYNNAGFNKFHDCVNSHTFDLFFCTCIVINAILMLVELEYMGRKIKQDIGLDEPGSNESPTLERIFEGLNTFFVYAFLVELVCRLAADGIFFLKKLTNWLDIIIVLSSMLEVLGAGNMMNLTFLRLIRLSKLTRLLRIVLMATFCNPLRILMKAIYTSFGSLFWSFVLLSMIQVIAALFMTQVLHDVIIDESRDLELRRFIYIYYGTTSRTTLTMFQMTMAPGAWGLLGRPIIEDVSPAYAWFFVLYVGGVSFTVIRIITALFLRQTLQVATGDEQLMRNEKVKAQRKYSESVRDLFAKADTSGSGEVSFEQFQALMTDAQIMAWLAVLELDAKNASCIFELVDDGDGRLTLDEFITGVFRLKGTAQQIDMVMLQRDAKEMKKTLVEFEAHLLNLTLLCRHLSDRALVTGFVPDVHDPTDYDGPDKSIDASGKLGGIDL